MIYQEFECEHIFEQVEKLRKLLQLKEREFSKIKEVRVGSVEQFQGTESRVIIISTVRSSDEFLRMDAIFKLGFLKNPKVANLFSYILTSHFIP